jgi:two-component sensor histidine kinase
MAMARSAAIEDLLDANAAGPAYPGCAGDCALRSEADHRVANHLAMLSSYIRLKAAEFDHPAGPPSRAAAQLFAQSLDGQVRAITRMHRLLISGQPDQPLALATLLHEVCAPYVSGMDRRIALIEDVADDCFARPCQIMPISQIVSEAITNAVKYAFPGGRTGIILVNCRRRADGGIRIEIVDNGVGLPKGFDPDRDGGFGFHLVRGLSRGMRAPITFSLDGRGLAVGLDLPLADAEPIASA